MHAPFFFLNEDIVVEWHAFALILSVPFLKTNINNVVSVLLFYVDWLQDGIYTIIIKA